MESDSSPKPSLLERISHWLMREPEDREQLIELLHGAYENSLMDADALSMIEACCRCQKCVSARS
jgi:magnesium and cobalt transporter